MAIAIDKSACPSGLPAGDDAGAKEVPASSSSSSVPHPMAGKASGEDDAGYIYNPKLKRGWWGVFRITPKFRDSKYGSYQVLTNL